MPSRETLDALTSDEFVAGFVFGLAALAVGALLAYWWVHRRHAPMPIVGLLVTGAALAALQTTGEPPSDLWAAAALLALGGAVYPWIRGIPLLPAALAAPGAWWITMATDPPGTAWVPWLLFGWVVVSAPLVTSFDRHFASRGYGPVLLTVSIAGVFATLPDTEEILVVLGVAVALSPLAWPRVLASLGAIGIYPALGMLAWIIAVGGRGRESAIIGATASLALLAVEPLVRSWKSHTLLDRIPNRWWAVPIAAGLQVVFVLLLSRGAGVRDTPQVAATASLIVLFSMAGVLALGRAQMADTPSGGSMGIANAVDHE